MLLVYECLHYSPPADQVVYDENPTTSAALLRYAVRYIADTRNDVRRTPIALLQPSQWSNAARSATPSLRVHGATVFMHERTAADGHSRLVVLQYSPTTLVPAFSPYTDLKITLLEASRLHGTLAEIEPDAEPPRKLLAHDLNASTRDLRIFAGQADGDDRSHFTIEYELNGQRGTLDGWLENDDTINIKLRSGPATRRS
jgi:hypothetical protein